MGGKSKIAAGCAAFLLITACQNKRRAVEALDRANEYLESGGLLWEPRYLEAERAVAQYGSDHLKTCLGDLKLSRESLEMAADTGSKAEHSVGEANDTDDAVFRKQMQDNAHLFTEIMGSALTSAKKERADFESCVAAFR